MINKYRLLVSTYHGAFIRPGGGEIELFEICNSLRKNNIDLDIYGPESREISAYDKVLHFGVNPDGYEFLKQVKNSNKEILLWPNLWWNDSQEVSTIECVRKIFDLADKVILKSKAELNNNEKFFPIDSKKVVFIPAGVSEQFFNIDTKVGQDFKRIYGVENYLLWIGVFQRNKNQIELIKALNSINIPVVFIGAGLESKYYEECIEISKENNIFIPQVPHNSQLLLGALSGCDGYIELTEEPAGLSVLEAAAAGKKILLVKGEWAYENFLEYVDFVESPFNHSEIRKWVSSLLKNKQKCEILARHIKKNHYLPNLINNLIEIL